MSNSNKILESFDDIIRLPKREEIIRGNEEEQMRILNDLESPSERVKTLYKSIINIRHEPTHEAFWIRKMALVSAASGLIIGGVLKNRDSHERYLRLHNASIFENKYVGNRHFWDTLITNVFTRGLKYGFRISLLTTSASLITFTSITYRNKLHLPDFLVGFATLGGLSRLWLGPKAVFVGSGIGVIGGLLGYGFGKSIELLSGLTVTQFRLIHHSEWLNRREAKLRKMQRLSEENFKELMNSGDMK